MARVLTSLKPIQRNCDGEIPEGLSEFTKSVACVSRSIRNLGDPIGSTLGVIQEVVSQPDEQVGRLMVYRESDSPIVL